MPNIFFKILFLIVAYLIGSIPTGYLIGKSKGIDIRDHGSNNIGATNTARVLGKKYFIIVTCLDALKGFLIVFLFRFKIFPSQWCLLSPIVYGISSTVGHVFPIFLRFKGGKAVATGAGVALGYSPNICLVGLIIFAIIHFTTKYVSLGSLCAAISILLTSVIVSLVTGEIDECLFSEPISNQWPLNLWFIIGVTIIVIIIIIKHKTNIERLKNNNENKFELIEENKS